MSAKLFRFSVVCLRTDLVAEFSASGETLDGAFRAGAVAAPATFADKQAGLRMFRIRVTNTHTGEFTAFLGQGATLAEAWGDGLKGARDTFRPKNDGRTRDANGLAVMLAPAAGDTHARGRVVTRSIESFEGDETYAAERVRKAREADRARLAQGGRVA